MSGRRSICYGQCRIAGAGACKVDSPPQRHLSACGHTQAGKGRRENKKKKGKRGRMKRERCAMEDEKTEDRRGKREDRRGER